MASAVRHTVIACHQVRWHLLHSLGLTMCVMLLSAESTGACYTSTRSVMPWLCLQRCAFSPSQIQVCSCVESYCVGAGAPTPGDNSTPLVFSPDHYRLHLFD
jgi:hypothetical protein